MQTNEVINIIKIKILYHVIKEICILIALLLTFDMEILM